MRFFVINNLLLVKWDFGVKVFVLFCGLENNGKIGEVYMKICWDVFLKFD